MKRFLAILCSMAMIFLICPSNAWASGQGNVDQGGGGMGQGTSSNKWTPGNDGVRVTVVDAESGSPVSGSVDFSNRSQPADLLNFGTVNKIQYRGGTNLSLPAIVNSKSRPANIEAINISAPNTPARQSHP